MVRPEVDVREHSSSEEGRSVTRMFPPRSVTSAAVSFWRRGQRTARAAYVVGALLLASGLIHLAFLTIGEGSWRGPLSLRKPTTFGPSFGLTW